MGSRDGGGGDGFADNWISSGWGLGLLRWLSNLSGLLGGLLGNLGGGLALNGGTELGEWRLWFLGLLIAGSALLLLAQPWEGALALVALDSWGLGLGLAVGGRSIGGISWDGSWGSNTGGLENVR